MKLILFEKEEIERVLKALNYTINKEGKVFYEGEQIFCESCGKAITVENLGNIFSPNRFFCDDPTCFAEYVKGEI